MKKLIFLFIFIPYFSTYAQNQDSLNAVFPKNTIFVDMLGQGDLSWNYDQIFYQKKRYKISYRLGFAVFPHGYEVETKTFYQGKARFTTDYYLDWTKYQCAFPLQINFMYGERKHFAEIGLGITPGWVYFPIYVLNNLNPIDHIGQLTNQYNIQLNYRRQSRKGLFFRPGIHFWTSSDWRNNLSPHIKYKVLNQVGNSNWLFIVSVGIGKSFGKK